MTVSLHPLACGTLTAPRSMFEVGGGDGDVELPVPAWLIRHPAGVVLFDTGMHTDLTTATPTRDLVSQFFGLGLGADDLVSARLSACDVGVDDVDFVVVSHLHFDHTGGLAQIPDARLVVQADEWAAGMDDDLAAANALQRDQFDLGHDRVEADGRHDVFGDGRVVCLPTPGHTPGHQSLLVRLDSGDVVLCGDCAYFEATLDGGPLPPLGHDHDMQRASLDLIRSHRDAGARVIPGHDADTFAALPAVLT